MKSKIKIFILSLFVSIFACFGIISIMATASMATSINVTLEQQENLANDKIRYISTITPVEDLNSITSISLELTATKDGQADKTASVPISHVYDEVTGTNGKAKTTNTYYSVYTITDLSEYAGWTLHVNFEYTYSDASSEATNTIDYAIPAGYTIDTLGIGSFGESSSITDCFTANSIQEGNIFHAWNWPIATITANLDAIYQAGYTAVQTSPMQPQKDYYTGDSISNTWWKLYQPLGFTIAESNENVLGTKSDLKTLCTQAKAKGLEVIVDVVANHLAGLSASGDVAKQTLHANVKKYEPEIYGTDGSVSGGAKLHEYTTCSDNNTKQVVWGNIGIPDLNTSDSVVQQRVLSLLKEYIDIGVTGFRFDAVKHIETPSDGEYASNFWPTVLGGATEYANSTKDFTPYYYGEILNTPGNGRSYKSYSAVGFSITDNTTGNSIRAGVVEGNVGKTSASTYNTGLDATQVVLWSESHDTYANDDASKTTNITQANIDKGYAMIGSRKGAVGLYLARPNSLSETFGGAVTEALHRDHVTAVNKFHNYWAGESEVVSNSSTFAMVTRYNSSESGMVLVNCSTGTSVSNVSVPSEMRDGSYIDLVSGTTFTVSSGKVSGTMDASLIAVLYDASATGSLSISASGASTFYSETMSTTFSIKNATGATMTIDGVKTTITDGATITFGSNMKVGDTFTVRIDATDGTKNINQTFVYEKVDAPAVYTVYFNNVPSWSKVNVYMWNSSTKLDNGGWPGVAMTYDEDLGLYYATYIEGEYDSIIFNNGDKAQTVDLELNPSSYNTYTPTTSTTVSGTTKYQATTKTTSTCSHDSFKYASNTTSHWKVCNLCEAKYDTVDHTWNLGEVTTPATMDATGIKTYTCTVCAKTKEEIIPQLGHEASSSWSHDSDSHWNACEKDGCEEKFNEASHTWDLGVVDGDVKTYTCTVCGETYDEPVSTTIRVFFTNNYAWTKVYAYSWEKADETNKNGTWPGVEMTQTKNSSNQTIYYIDIDSSLDMIIFNDSYGHQTVNISLTDYSSTKAYNITGSSDGKYTIQLVDNN